MVYFGNKAKNNNQDKAESDEKESRDLKKNEEIKSQSVDIADFNLDIAKSEASEKISERHEEAKKVMSESVHTIFDDTLPETTKNEEIKNKISEDLDNL